MEQRNQIVLTNWSIPEAEELLIKDCLANNPGKNTHQLGVFLKVSGRTVRRKLLEYGLIKPNICLRKTKKSII